MNKRRYGTIYQRYLIGLLLITAIFILTGCQFSTKNQSGANWIDVNLDEAKELQEQVDNGHRVGLLDPQQVAWDFLTNFLQLKGDIKLVQVEKTDQGLIFKATSQSKTIELTLIQPVKNDTTGVWMVQKYRYRE